MEASQLLDRCLLEKAVARIYSTCESAIEVDTTKIWWSPVDGPMSVCGPSVSWSRWLPFPTDLQQRLKLELRKERRLAKWGKRVYRDMFRMQTVSEIQTPRMVTKVTSYVHVHTFLPSGPCKHCIFLQDEPQIDALTLREEWRWFRHQPLPHKVVILRNTLVNHALNALLCNVKHVFCQSLFWLFRIYHFPATRHCLFYTYVHAPTKIATRIHT